MGANPITLMKTVPNTENKAAEKGYSFWLCGKECKNSVEYLVHLQAHKDAIDMQEI